MVKRALGRLRVAQEWTAPVSRNASEVAWIQTAGSVVPDAVPRVLADDPVVGAFESGTVGRSGVGIQSLSCASVRRELPVPTQSREAMTPSHVGSDVAVEVVAGRIGLVGTDFLPIPPSE